MLNPDLKSGFKPKLRLTSVQRKVSAEGLRVVKSKLRFKTKMFKNRTALSLYLSILIRFGPKFGLKLKF